MARRARENLDVPAVPGVRFVTSEKPTINSVQALRGVAALMVVAFHFRGGVNGTFPGVGDRLFINGPMGVDLFFLISGFITFYIANGLNAGPRSSWEFMAKRICRVVPLYYIVTLLTPINSMQALTNIGKSLLFIPLDGAQSGPAYGYATIFVGWTLNYEMLFYALAAAAICFGPRKWGALATIIAGLTLAPALVFGWNGLNTHLGYPFGNVYLKLATNPMLLEFLCGTAIGYIYSTKGAPTHRWFWTLFVGASAVFFAYCYFSETLRGNRPLGWMVPSFFLLFSLVEFEKRFPIAWPKLVLYLGTISYSIYVLHYQVYHNVDKVLQRTPLSALPYYGLILFCVGALVTIALSGLSHKYIEVGLSKKLRGVLLRRAKKPAYAVRVSGAQS